jgi:hypothetical protein
MTTARKTEEMVGDCNRPLTRPNTGMEDDDVDDQIPNIAE